MCEKNGKKVKNNKGDEKMENTTKKPNKNTNNNKERNINEILNKGIERYDKALEKLSKN